MVRMNEYTRKVMKVWIVSQTTFTVIKYQTLYYPTLVNTLLYPALPYSRFFLFISHIVPGVLKKFPH